VASMCHPDESLQHQLNAKPYYVNDLTIHILFLFETLCLIWSEHRHHHRPQCRPHQPRIEAVAATKKASGGEYGTLNYALLMLNLNST
jgi:hypothetical protein